jgi:hypothetical protein
MKKLLFASMLGGLFTVALVNVTNHRVQAQAAPAPAPFKLFVDGQEVVPVNGEIHINILDSRPYLATDHRRWDIHVTNGTVAVGVYPERPSPTLTDPHAVDKKK